MCLADWFFCFFEMILKQSSPQETEREESRTPFASLISVLGDLSFSMIKRQFQIKDFGKIMPGHGGVLDRFDSVLFTLPFIYATTLCFPVCQIVA